MTYPTAAPKVDIDRYFAEFEVHQSAPTTLSIPAEVHLNPPATPLAVLALPAYTPTGKSTLRKELNGDDIGRASAELVHLRSQLSHSMAAQHPWHQGYLRPTGLSLGTITRTIAGLSVLGFCLGLPWVNTLCHQHPQCTTTVTQAIAPIRGVVSQVVPQKLTLKTLIPSLSPTANLPLPTGPNPLQTAQRQGYQAALLTQSAVTPDEWSTVVEHWENALTTLGNIPSDSPFHGQAQDTIHTYRQNLAYARSEIDPFREAVNSAMAAAQLTQIAQHPEQWSTVSQQWLEAIALMEQVPSASPYYGLSQQKIAEYAKNLAYAQQQVIQP